MSAPPRTEEWDGGERYGDEGDYWYHRVRGQVRGTDPGDEVEVWFVAENKSGRGRRHREPLVHLQRAQSDSGARVLVLAQEDYTGNSAFPAYASTDGPFYLSYYAAALEANGVDYDVYDLDARGPRGARRARSPEPLRRGDLVHRQRQRHARCAATAGVAGEEAHLTTMAVRDFVNEGGTVALSVGDNAGRQYDLVEYPQDGLPLEHVRWRPTAPRTAASAPPLSNDFLQYYLGSYVRADGGGLNPAGGVFDVVGLSSPLEGLTLSLNDPAASAGNQDVRVPGFASTGTHLVTSSILEPENYPQFASEEAADWVTGEAPFDPHTGVVVHDLAEPQPGVQAPDAHGGPARRDQRQPVVLDLVQHGARLGLRVRRGAVDQRRRHRLRATGRRCPTRTGTPATDTGASCAGRMVGGAPQPAPQLRDLRPGPARTPARRPGRPVRGTPPPATPAAGRSGAST